MTAATVHVKTFDEFMTRPRTSWLVEDLIPEGEVAAMYGLPGSFKSFVALELAGCVSQGRSFAGRATRQGRVLYLVAEGVGGMRDRLDVLAREGRLDPANVAVVDMGCQIGNSDQRKALAAALGRREFFPDLIIVDTLARHAIGVRENDNGEMGAWIAEVEELVRQFRCTALVVHHCGRDESRGMRGATALLGAVATVLKCSKSGGKATITCEKQKDADEAAAFSFQARKAQHGDIESLVLDHVDGGKKEPDRLKPSEKAILTALRAKYPDSVKRSELKHLSGRDIPDSTFDRAIDNLIGLGHAEKIDHGEYLLRKSPSPNYPQESPTGTSSTPDKSPPSPPPYKGGDVGIWGGRSDGKVVEIPKHTTKQPSDPEPQPCTVPSFADVIGWEPRQARRQA